MVLPERLSVPNGHGLLGGRVNATKRTPSTQNTNDDNVNGNDNDADADANTNTDYDSDNGNINLTAYHS